MTPETELSPKPLSIPEFAARIRAKHPRVYDEVDDRTLAARVAHKYPKYLERVDFGDPVENEAAAQAAKANVDTARANLSAAVHGELSPLGRQLNPDVVQTVKRPKLKPNEEGIVSLASDSSTVPAATSTPAVVETPPVALAPVIQSRLDAAKKLRRQQEIQRRVANARRVRERQRPSVQQPIDYAAEGLTDAGDPALRPQPSGAGELRKRDAPALAQILRIERQVDRDLALGGDTIRNRPSVTPHQEVLRRLADEKAREAETNAQAAWFQDNAQAIADQKAQYRADIQKAKARGGDPNKWLAEMGTKAAAGLTELTGGVIKPLDPDLANKLRVHVAAAQQAAQEEGADRGAVSRLAQDISAGFVSSAPELAAMMSGVSAPLVFGAGSGVRAYGADRPIVPAAAKGALTGAAFELPVGGAGLGHIARKAGAVGAGTGAVELGFGATPMEALKAGATNALLSIAPAATRIPKAVVDYTMKSPITPEPVKNVVADALKYGKGMVTSPDGRNMSLYADPKTGEVFGAEITPEQAKKYDPTIITGEKRPVRNAKEVDPEDYDILARTLGIETKVPRRQIAGEVLKPEPKVEKTVAVPKSEVTSEKPNELIAEIAKPEQKARAQSLSEVANKISTIPTVPVEPTKAETEVIQSSPVEVPPSTPVASPKIQQEAKAPARVAASPTSEAGTRPGTLREELLNRAGRKIVENLRKDLEDVTSGDMRELEREMPRNKPAPESVLTQSLDPYGADTHQIARAILKTPKWKERVLSELGEGTQPLENSGGPPTWRTANGDIVKISNAYGSDKEPTLGTRLSGIVIEREKGAAPPDVPIPENVAAPSPSEIRTSGEAGKELSTPPAESERQPVEPAPETPEFKRWFGRSKVVDERGAPLRVYHGTNQSFDSFDMAIRAQKGREIEGAYFSPDKKVAEFFAGAGGKPRHVVEAYLSLENPYVNRNPAEAMRDLGVTSEAELTAALKQRGYDGVIFNEGFTWKGGTAKEIIAFEPHQIKSATYNTGAFSKANPSISDSPIDQPSTPSVAEGSQPPKAVADISPSVEEPKPATSENRPPEAASKVQVRASSSQLPPSKTSNAAQKLPEWGKRLKSIAESKNLDDLRALSDEMAAHKDDPRVQRLRTTIQAELARARQPNIPERPSEPARTQAEEPRKLSKAAQKTLAESERPEGKTVRPKPTHRIGAPKSNPAKNSLSEEVRALGGIKSERHGANRGEIQFLKESGKRGLINETGGMDAESMAGALAQRGYFPPGVDQTKTGFTVSNVDDFLASVADDAMGHTKHYSTEYDVIESDPDVEAWDRLNETDSYSKELIEKVESGDAKASDIAELARVAKAEGLSDDALDAYLNSLHRTLAEELHPGTEEAEGYTLDQDGTLLDPDGTPLFSRVFHGSPHTFDKFDMSKVGTGEGAQAYGYGLYFTDKKEIAEHYRNNLTASYAEFADGKPLRGGIADANTTPERLAEIVLAPTTDRAAALKTIATDGVFLGEEGQRIARQWIEEGKITWPKREGKTYEVELAPKDDEYLLWDKPLNRQSGRVQQIIMDAAKKNPSSNALNEAFAAITGASDAFDELKGSDFYRRFAGDRRESENVSVIAGPKAEKIASEKLHLLGIRGIKYLDNSSRFAGEGTYNYVIFSDADAEIIQQPQFSRQLGLPSEGLTQESARPKTTSQRDALIEAERARQEAADPERAAALKTLAEIRRRGMTVDEYARQGDLFGATPSAKELKLLRELETPSKAKRESAQSSMFARGEGEPELSSVSVEGNRISLSGPAITDFSNAVVKLRSGEPVTGAYMPRVFAFKVAKELESTNPELATALNDAAKKHPYIRVESTKAKRHEDLHEQSHKLSGFKELDERLTSEGFKSVTSDAPEWDDIEQGLLDLGYQTTFHGMVEEAYANLADGKYQELGITEAQAKSWLARWFKAYAEANGNQTLQQFKELSDDADEALRTARTNTRGSETEIGKQGEDVRGMAEGRRSGDSKTVERTGSGEKTELFSRDSDPWSRLSDLADEFDRIANEPDLPVGEKPLSLPKTLDAAQLESGPTKGYTPETLAEGVEYGKHTVLEKGIDGAIEFVRHGDGIEWASTGFEVSAQLRAEEARLRAEGNTEEADQTQEKRFKFLDDFALAAVERGRSIVGIKAVAEFSPDRMAYMLNKVSLKKRKRGISPEEDARIAQLGEELGALEDRNKALEKALEIAKASASKRAPSKGKAQKQDYQSKLDAQAESVLLTLKPKVGKFDFAGLGRSSEKGALTIGIPPLPGDAELIAQYAASRLSKLNTVAELNDHLLSEFGPEVEPYLPKIRQRAYGIRQEARLAEIEAQDTEPKRRKTILSEIQKEIAESLTAIRDAQKAQESALKAERRAQATEMRAEARSAAKQAREAEHERQKQIIKEARAELKRLREEMKQASRAETAGYRETIKAQREAARRAELWDTPLRNEAVAARERLKTATDPKDPQTMADLVSVAAEKFLPEEVGGVPRKAGVEPAKVYRDLKDEFPDLVTKKNQGEIYKRGYQRIQDMTAAAREAARLRIANEESKRLWDELGADVDAQAIIIKQTEIRRQQQELRSKAAAEFARVSRSKFTRAMHEVQAFPRSARSAVDAPTGRQGLYYLMTHPLVTLRQGVPAGARGYAALHSEDYVRLSADIASHPDYDLAQKAELDLTELASLTDPRLHAEEQHQSSLAEKLPHVRISEQAYIAQMNATRLGIFHVIATLGKAEGYTWEANPEFFRQAATVVNIGSGRGDFGEGKVAEFFQKLASVSNFLFWATRWGVSKFQLANNLVNPFKYLPAKGPDARWWRTNPLDGVPGFNSYDPVLRKFQLLELVRLGLALGALYGLAKLAGLDVSQFPIIRYKNTRFDLSGGEVNNARLIMSFAAAADAWMSETPTKQQKQEDAFADIAHYGRGKLAPIPGGIVDAYYGKDFTGADVNTWPLVRHPELMAKEKPTGKLVMQNIILKQLLPMVTYDFADAAADSGWMGLLIATPALAGVGTNTYPDTGLKALKNKSLAKELVRLGFDNTNVLGQRTKDEDLDNFIQQRILERVEQLKVPEGTDVGKKQLLSESLEQIKKLSKAEAAIDQPGRYVDYLKNRDGNESMSFLTDAEKAQLTESDLKQYRARYADAYVDTLKKAASEQYGKLDDDQKVKLLNRVSRVASTLAKRELIGTKRK